MPDEVVEFVKSKKNIAVKYAAAPTPEVMAELDVLYVTRIQKERFASADDYDAIKGSYVISKETLKAAKQKMIVMHPLPRVDEISTDVDSDPRAAYFRQMKCGLHLRMALLTVTFGKAEMFEKK